MEEFPDNPKITETIKKYQIKKNNIKNNYKARPRLYSWNKLESNDIKRIFIFANNKDDNIKNKNDQIKKELEELIILRILNLLIIPIITYL